MTQSDYAAYLPIVDAKTSIGEAFDVMRTASAVAVVSPVMGGYHFREAVKLVEAVARMPDFEAAIQRPLSELKGVEMGRIEVVDVFDPPEAGLAPFDDKRIGQIFAGHSSPVLVASTYELDGMSMATALGNPLTLMRLVPRGYVCPKGGERRTRGGYCSDHDTHFVPVP